MKKRSCKVLFIGNSHTYYNDMAYMLKFLSGAGETGYVIDPVMLAHPGKTLGEHKDEPEVRFNILYGEYDFVVLQQAAHPFPGKEVLVNDARQILTYIGQTNAIPVSFMTWAEKDKPGNQQIMAEAYAELTELTGGILCPAGLAWKRVIESNRNINLFDADGEHANAAGSYLTACVFYSVLLQSNPGGLPGKITYGDHIICDLPEETASILHQAAWSTAKLHLAD